MAPFFEKYRFWVRCFGIVWGALTVTFLCYWSSFFVGNHDFRYMRYGVPLTAGMFEGRFSQFLISSILTEGHILPAFNVLLGFGFFSAATVMLSKWFGLSEKYREVLPFALMIALNPYVLTQLYYVHQILSIFCWHLWCVWGVMLVDRAALLANEGKTAAGQHAVPYTATRMRIAGYAAAGILVLFVSLGGYAASLELVLTVCVGKFWLDILRKKTKMREILPHYVKLGIIVAAAFFCYAAVIWEMRRQNIIVQHMYNVQTLALGEVWDKFKLQWQRPWNVLWLAFPYDLPFAGYCFMATATAALAASWLKGKLLWGIFCLAALVYAAFCLAFATPHDFFETFRIHSYSVPYLMAVLFAVPFVCGNKLLRNLALAVAVALICLFAKADYWAQKVWLLGNRQDELYTERIKADLLPRLQPGKKYRLTTLGGLYGREKFAGVEHAYSQRIYERNRELFTGPLYVSIMFSSGFFLSESENPILGDAVYLEGIIFYGMTTENIPKDKMIDAELFAKSFGNDKEAQLQALKIMQPYPSSKYCFVGQKDIFLMMPQVGSDKEKLIRFIVSQ